MASKNSRRSSTFLLIIRLSFANNFMKIYIVRMALDASSCILSKRTLKTLAKQTDKETIVTNLK